MTLQPLRDENRALTGTVEVMQRVVAFLYVAYLGGVYIGSEILSLLGHPSPISRVLVTSIIESSPVKNVVLMGLMTVLFLLAMRMWWCAVHNIAFMSTGVLCVYFGFVYAFHGEWPLFCALIGMAVSAMLLAFLKHQPYPRPK